VCTACALTAAVPAGASADDAVAVQRDGATLVVAGTDGRDEVGIAWTPGSVVAVTNAYKVVSSGAGCETDAGGRGLCANDGIESIEVHLGDGDDTLVTNGGLPVHAYGEGGNDRLLAADGPTAAPVFFDGGPGDDRLAGSPLADTLIGGPGADGIETGGGNDLVDADDGDADVVHCTGAPTLRLDPSDAARDCRGVLPAATASAVDCTPEISAPATVSLRHLRATRTLVLHATASAGCAIHASLAWHDAVLAGATAARPAGRLVLRLNAGTIRRLRPSGLTVRISSAAAGRHVVRRSIAVRVVR
jgi:Ca2+-binding RTX toxin-like protein